MEFWGSNIKNECNARFEKPKYINRPYNKKRLQKE